MRCALCCFCVDWEVRGDVRVIRGGVPSTSSVYATFSKGSLFVAMYPLSERWGVSESSRLCMTPDATDKTLNNEILGYL